MRRIALLLFVFTFLASPALAQYEDPLPEKWAGVSYSTNLPDQYIGFGFRYVEREDVGGFVHIKTSRFPSETETYENISQDTFEDRQVGSLTNHISMSGGLTYGIAKRFHVWGGVGFTVVTDYSELQDPTDILGSRDGKYWVIEDRKGKVKALGGIGTNGKNWYALLGGEYNPTGVNLTIGLKF